MRLPPLGFEHYLKLYHGLDPCDVEPTDTPGYWRVKNGCPGGEECRHAFRSAVGPCDGSVESTIYYAPEDRDERGRWLSPFLEWRRQKQMHGAAKGGG